MTEELIALDVWDKLLILVGVALFMVLVIVMLMCVLSPYCCLYPYCPFRVKNPLDGKPLINYGSTDIMRESKHDRRSYLGSIKEEESSEWSDASAKSALELRRTMSPGYVPNGSIGSLHLVSQIHDGTLHFSLKYDKFDNDLLIKILEVTDLNVEDKTAILSPYIRVRLYRSHRQLFTGAVENVDTEFKTRIQKFKDNLTFNETFKTSIAVTSVKHISIKFQLCDLDKYSRKIVIGECLMKLKKIHLEDFEEKVFQEKLRAPIEEESGEISIGLNYLPTAEKLYINVVKMKIYKTPNRPQNVLDTYIKVVLMHDGKPLKKTRTGTKTEESNPEFDETFPFDVPTHELEKVYVAISAISLNTENSEQKLLGRIYIGLPFGGSAQEHWAEMIRSPRNQVQHVHKLTEQ
ncbi:synaptotagmin-C-like [Saccostrea echinata]|uniref:synaptotagmin-C-like n=1 Tax=Saccostrea echinata TaxID=191078 RepID=UPI002A837F72|nr:synaptotagmin-C-like [Saccostrea echinata]